MQLKSLEKANRLAALQDAIEHMMEQTAPDGRLPTERELAQIVGSSRHAVRQALERLEAAGRISRHVGRGTYRGRPVGEGNTDPRLIARHANPREIAEARRLIEPQIAMLAAINATAAQIAAIEVHTKHCASARNLDAYEVADELFHRSIAAATGNAVLKALFESINDVRKSIIWGKMRRSGLSRARRDVFAAQHERIYEAIVNRDPEEAGAAMRVHTDTIAEVYSAFDYSNGLGAGHAPATGAKQK